MWFLLLYFLQLVFLLAVSSSVSARLKRSQIEQDVCGKSVMEGETKRYAMSVKSKKVTEWPIILLITAVCVYVVACLGYTVKKSDSGLTKVPKDLWVCIVLALVHLGVLVYMKTLQFSDKAYLKNLSVLGRFLKQLGERPKSMLPLGFASLHQRVADRVAAKLQLSSREDAILKMQSMDAVALAAYYQPQQDQDYKLILPEFNCRLLYASCKEGRFPSCVKEDGTKCTEKNAVSPVSRVFDETNIEENFARVTAVYNTIERLRDMKYAEPTNMVKKKTLLIRIYVYLMLGIIGAWAFHVLYQKVDAMSITAIVLLAVLISIYAGAYVP